VPATASGRAVFSWAQAWQGGWPGSVLRENTLARIRGPAITPTAAPAMIHGSVTVFPRSACCREFQAVVRHIWFCSLESLHRYRIFVIGPGA
jgi:hypothetical protein